MDDRALRYIRDTQLPSLDVGLLELCFGEGAGICGTDDDAQNGTPSILSSILDIANSTPGPPPQSDGHLMKPLHLSDLYTTRIQKSNILHVMLPEVVRGLSQDQMPVLMPRCLLMRLRLLDILIYLQHQKSHSIRTRTGFLSLYGSVAHEGVF